MYKLLIVATVALAANLVVPKTNASPLPGFGGGYGGYGGGFGGHHGGFGGHHGGFGGGFGGYHGGQGGFGGGFGGHHGGHHGGFGGHYGGHHGGFGGHIGHGYQKRSADAETLDVDVAAPEIENANFDTPINSNEEALSSLFSYDDIHFIGKREAEPGFGFGGYGGGFGHGRGGYFGGHRGGYFGGYNRRRFGGGFGFGRRGHFF